MYDVPHKFRDSICPSNALLELSLQKTLLTCYRKNHKFCNGLTTLNVSYSNRMIHFTFSGRSILLARPEHRMNNVKIMNFRFFVGTMCKTKNFRYGKHLPQKNYNNALGENVVRNKSVAKKNSCTYLKYCTVVYSNN